MICTYCNKETRNYYANKFIYYICDNCQDTDCKITFMYYNPLFFHNMKEDIQTVLITMPSAELSIFPNDDEIVLTYGPLKMACNEILFTFDSCTLNLFNLHDMVKKINKLKVFL